MTITVDGTNNTVVFPGTVSGRITLAATPASGVRTNYLPDADGTLLILRTNNTIVIPSSGGGTITLAAPPISTNVDFVFPPTEGNAGEVLTTDGAGNTSWGFNGVSTWSGGTTGLTPNTPTMGAIVLGGTLNIANGGTGLSAFGVGVQAALAINVNAANGFGVLNNFGVLNIAQGGTGGSTANIAFNNLAPPQTGFAGYVLTTDSSNTSWTDPTAILVTSFSCGTTGLTPSVATAGNIVLGGTLIVGNGGTGMTSGTSGGIPFFSSTTTMGSSALLASANLVLGGGAGTAPYTTATGTGVVTALGNAVNTAGGFPVLNGSAVVPIAQGGTNATTAAAAANNLLPPQSAPQFGYILSTDGAGNLSWVSNSAFLAIATPITNGSVANSLLISDASNNLAQILMGSGVAAALAINTNTAGGFSVLNGSGVLPIAQGGTNANTAAAAANNLLPAQSGPAGKVLASDGAGNLSWVNNDSGLTINTTQIASGTTGSILTQTGTTLTELVMGLGVSTALGIAPNTNGGMMLAGVGGVLPVAQGGTGLSALGTGVQTALGQNMGTANGFAALNGSGVLPIAQGGTALSALGTGVQTALSQNMGTANGFAALDGTGALPYTQGGSGLTTLGTAGQVLTVNPGATGIIWSNPILKVGTTQIESGATGSLLIQTGTALQEILMGTGVAAALAINTNTANGFPTQAVTFTNGSVIFYNGTQLDQNNAQLFWNNGVTALCIGTTTAPTVSGAKLRVESDAQINGLTVGLGGGQIASCVAVGLNALAGNTVAKSIGIGESALQNQTGVGQSVAVGWNAGINNSGSGLVAIGYNAGINNSGSGLVAIGAIAGQNVTGGGITAVGTGAYTAGGSGSNCVAVGVSSMASSNSGSSNCAVGVLSLYANTSGSFNTAIGSSALQPNSTGSFNTCVGYASGFSSSGSDYNTAVGYRSFANGTGFNNTCIGSNSGSLITSGSDNVIIGANNGLTFPIAGTGNNWIVLSSGDGIASAWEQTTSPGWFQQNNSASWSVTSDARLKENVTDIKNSWNIIKSIRPVEFDYKETGKHDIGWIAQEFKEFLPEQVSEKEDGYLAISANLDPHIVSVIQTLMAKIEELEKKVK
jgi:hypothetical protein